MQNLKILALSFDILWKQLKLNFEKIENLLENYEADVILLPEMFSTGFCMDASEIADEKSQVLEWMKRLALKKSAVVAGTVSVCENEKYFNRFYFVKPDGSFSFYDKRHLFSYSGEDKIYEKGNKRVIVNYKGVRFLLQICYDLRFPVFSRNQNDYDVVLYLANWPSKRINAWKTLLSARSIENQAYVFGVNRTGRDGNQLDYPLSSYCFFPDGEIVSKNDGIISVAEIDLDKLNQFRKRFDFLSDRDYFELNF